jgi:cell wall assembly regulator SMI1
MESIQNAWQRIDVWLKAHAPHVQKELNPGVSEEEIQQKEAAISVPLPEDFKTSYRIHNGSRSRYDGTSGSQYALMGCDAFYPLKRVVGGEAGMYQDLLQDTYWAGQTPGWVSDPTRQPLPVQPVWRHPLWLTFAEHLGGLEWCLDLAPAPDGRIGQVISWDHEDGPAEVLFSSFEELLSTYADELEAGLCLGVYASVGALKRAQLKERRATFLSSSPAKPVLLQAIELAWSNSLEESLRIFGQVLQMPEATPEDRFQAYSGFISLAGIYPWGNFPHEAQRFLAQWEAETHTLPETHWTRQELALFTQRRR